MVINAMEKDKARQVAEVKGKVGSCALNRWAGNT